MYDGVEKNMEEMTGEWVILKGDKIVERNKDIKVILNLAKNYDDKEITISKIPSVTSVFFNYYI